MIVWDFPFLRGVHQYLRLCDWRAGSEEPWRKALSLHRFHLCLRHGPWNWSQPRQDTARVFWLVKISHFLPFYSILAPFFCRNIRIIGRIILWSVFCGGQWVGRGIVDNCFVAAASESAVVDWCFLLRLRDVRVNHYVRVLLPIT